MNGYLEIVTVGFQTAIQDQGRTGFQEFGVPQSGTVAPSWMELGNALVGNVGCLAGLEFRAMGPTLRTVDGVVKLVVCGNVRCEIVSKTETSSTSHSIGNWRSFTLNPGDEVKIGALEDSSAGFIAIGGGIDVVAVMESRSTYARSSIGGLNGRMLEVGDQLPLGQKAQGLAQAGDCVLPSPPTDRSDTVRVVLGPQDDYFEQSEIERFLSAEYTISKAFDRMGARLDGPTLSHAKGMRAEIASDGVVPGAIQVPGSGSPIVILNDGQTVGGYPKIAVVISCDLEKIANSMTGQPVRFEVVSAQEACLIARREKDKLEQQKRSIIKAQANGFVNLNALYRENLIGGVVDMANPDHLEET